MDMSTTLVREAEQAGFEVERTEGGHIRYKAPDGAIIIGASTPSDHRSVKNDRALLKRHGLEHREASPQEEKRLTKAKDATEQVSATVALLSFLQERPGQPVPVEEVAAALDKNSKQVNGAYVFLRSLHPEISKHDNALLWKPIERPVPVEPVKKRRRSGLGAEILQIMRDNPYKVYGPEDLAKEIVDANRGSVNQALIQLERGLDDVEKLGRGRYSYRPKEPDEKTKARARLRLIEREMKEASPMARTLYMAEKARLEAVVSGVKPMTPIPPPESQPVEVAMMESPLRPITVMPTALPEGCPGMFEAVTLLNTGDLLLRDENGTIWAAAPIKVERLSLTVDTLS